MYYSEYDYMLLVEKSVSIDSSDSNKYNNEISYQIEGTGNYYTRLNTDGNNLYSEYKELSEFLNEQMYLIISRHGGTINRKQIYERATSNLDQYLEDITGLNIYCPSGYNYFIFVNGENIPYATVNKTGDYITSISDMYIGTGVFLNNKNSYMIIISKLIYPTIIGYDSDSYTNKTQFLTMESLEGTFSYSKDHEYIEVIEQNDTVIKKIKNRKFNINIQEPEYEKSLLDIFKKNDIIKIIKLYDDRIEEFYNCTLNNTPVLSEETDVNKRNYEIICSDVYIRYFDDNNNFSGGIRID